MFGGNEMQRKKERVRAKEEERRGWWEWEVNLISLTVLGLSSKVDDDVELGAGLLEGVSAVDTGIRGKVALLVVDDGVGKGSSVGSTEEGGGREDLVDDTNVRAEVALDEVGHEIAANEANSSKNENFRFSSHVDDVVFVVVVRFLCVSSLPLCACFELPSSFLPRAKVAVDGCSGTKRKKIITSLPLFAQQKGPQS